MKSIWKNVEEMPILFPTDAGLRDRIVRVVTELQNLDAEIRKGWGSVRRPRTVDGFRNLNENWMMWSTTCTGSTSAERDLVARIVRCRTGSVLSE